VFLFFTLSLVEQCLEFLKSFSKAQDLRFKPKSYLKEKEHTAVFIRASTVCMGRKQEKKIHYFHPACVAKV